MSVLSDDYIVDSNPVQSGGQAEVFQAYERGALHRHVAIKLFNQKVLSSPFFAEMFQREADALSRLKHPNIVAMHTWGTDDATGRPYMVLEWIDDDLFELSRRQPFGGWDDLAPLILGTLCGLAEAHKKEITHRDIKPENILIDGQPRIPKVSDFGISKRHSAPMRQETVGAWGTGLYRPADVDENESDYTQDVYAVGVMIAFLLGERSLQTMADVRQTLSELYVPEAIRVFAQTCVAEERAERFPSAIEAFRVLDQIERQRLASDQDYMAVSVKVPTKWQQAVGEILGVDESEASNLIIEELNAAGVIGTADERALLEGGGDSDLLPPIVVAGLNFLFHLGRDRESGSYLFVMKASKFPPSRLEQMREGHLPLPVRFTPLRPHSSPNAEALSQLYDQLTEAVQERMLEGRLNHKRRLLQTWTDVVEARRDALRRQGKPVRYSSLSPIDERRVALGIANADKFVRQNEPRLIRVGEGMPVAGVIEDVSETEVVLFVERGRIDSLRAAGVLEYDTELSRAALNREKRAVEALRYGMASRPELADLLAEPASSRVPRPVRDFVPHLDDLDKSKREAVESALGMDDFFVLEGPPGTGKTTFIAELVTAFLQKNPGSRVLIASQTNVALDNALERIREFAPDRRLVRLGREERIGVLVGDLHHEDQIELWRQEVLSKSRTYLASYAAEHGVKLDYASVDSLVRRLKQEIESEHKLRSRIQLVQDERRMLSTELETVRDLAPSVLSAAELIEAQASDLGADALKQAAERYVQMGVDLASRLEQARPLAARVAERDERLESLRAELDVRLLSSAALVDELRPLVGTSGQDSPGIDDLIALAEAQLGEVDPVLEPLQQLLVEWEQRFGVGAEFTGALLARADVVAATCVGLAARESRDVLFDLCIVDEATKATATETLIPLVRSRKWVLVGDRRQLPPFGEDLSADAELVKRYPMLAEDEYRKNVFDLLCEGLPDECRTSLTEQRRMVPAIGALVSDCFYEGALLSHFREPDDGVVMAFGNPVLWFSTSHVASRADRIVGTSVANHVEVQAAVCLLQRLQLVANAARRRYRVAVLTGYAAQRERLERAVAKAKPALPDLDIEVNVVDAFQGREADVTIFSLARSNKDGYLGFLNIEERINVALSRGRDGLAIVGDSDFVLKSKADPNPLARVFRHINDREDCTVEYFDSEER